MASLPTNSQTPTLFLLDSLNLSGSEKRAVRIANELVRRGLPVHLGYLNAPHTQLADLRHDLPRVCLERKGKLSPRAAWSLVHYAVHHSIGHIFCFNLYPLLYAALAQRLWRRGPLRRSVSLNLNEPRNRIEKAKMLLYGPLLRGSERIVFGSHEQSRRWVERYGLEPSSCMHILNGVDVDWFAAEGFSDAGAQLRRKLGVAADEIVLGMVANYRPWKRYPEMLEACARLLREGLPVRALLVGQGTLDPELAREASRRGLTAAVLPMGQLADVRPALAAMDVFVLTSSSETFSNAALEAMAMGTPVVLSRVGGLPEMVREGENGYLYAAGDTEDLVSRLRALVEDRDARRHMGAAARRIVEESFTFERMVDSYVKLVSDA